MDFDQIYHFLFQTFPGIGCLVGAGLVICLIACIITEKVICRPPFPQSLAALFTIGAR